MVDDGNGTAGNVDGDRNTNMGYEDTGKKRPRVKTKKRKSGDVTTTEAQDVVDVTTRRESDGKASSDELNVNSVVDLLIGATTFEPAARDREAEPSRRNYWKVFQLAGMCLFWVTYCLVGAFIFMKLEGSEEQDLSKSITSVQKRVVEHLQNVIERRNVTQDSRAWADEADVLLTEYREAVTSSLLSTARDCEGRTKWTFSGSLLFVVSVLTTVGYGVIAPVTTPGRIATMVYAVIGIPMTALCLASLGRSMANLFRVLYAKTFLRLCVSDDDRDKVVRNPRVPVWFCCVLIAVYVYLGALLFGQWEGWDYLVALYFCFTTLSTIGFGDFVPGSSCHKGKQNDQGAEQQTLCVVYLAIGLALLVMCFDLMRPEYRSCLHNCMGCIGTTDKYGHDADDAECVERLQPGQKRRSRMTLKRLLRKGTGDNVPVQGKPEEKPDQKSAKSNPQDDIQNRRHGKDKREVHFSSDPTSEHSFKSTIENRRLSDVRRAERTRTSKNAVQLSSTRQLHDITVPKHLQDGGSRRATVEFKTNDFHDNKQRKSLDSTSNRPLLEITIPKHLQDGTSRGKSLHSTLTSNRPFPQITVPKGLHNSPWSISRESTTESSSQETTVTTDSKDEMSSGKSVVSRPTRPFQEFAVPKRVSEGKSARTFLESTTESSSQETTLTTDSCDEIARRNSLVSRATRPFQEIKVPKDLRDDASRRKLVEPTSKRPSQEITAPKGFQDGRTFLESATQSTSQETTVSTDSHDEACKIKPGVSGTTNPSQEITEPRNWHDEASGRKSRDPTSNRPFQEIAVPEGPHDSGPRKTFLESTTGSSPQDNTASTDSLDEMYRGTSAALRSTRPSQEITVPKALRDGMSSRLFFERTSGSSSRETVISTGFHDKIPKRQSVVSRATRPAQELKVPEGSHDEASKRTLVGPTIKRSPDEFTIHRDFHEGLGRPRGAFLEPRTEIYFEEITIPWHDEAFMGKYVEPTTEAPPKQIREETKDLLDVIRKSVESSSTTPQEVTARRVSFKDRITGVTSEPTTPMLDSKYGTKNSTGKKSSRTIPDPVSEMGSHSTSRATSSESKSTESKSSESKSSTADSSASASSTSASSSTTATSSTSS